MEWLWLTLGVVFAIAGLAGSILPILPGPPLSYLAILILHLTNYHTYTDRFLISWLIITIVVAVLDYLIPIIGTKKFGGSNTGVWGATIGLLAGVIFFPPIGMIIWSFVGAIVGELIAGKQFEVALKAGTGTFVGFLAGTVAKLVVSLIMAVFFFQALI